MTSIIFPGQGSQYLEMSKDFYDNFPNAKKNFEEIQEYVDLDLKKIIFKNEGNLLNQTNYTQISIFAASYIIYKTLEEEKGMLQNVSCMFGHSLGEYTALACSDKLSLKNVSIILKKRGELMHNAIEHHTTGMVALIGKNSDEVQKIINDNSIDLEIANDNSPVQIVVSGTIDNIDKYKNVFLDNGIKKYIKLNVSSAFHSKYMIDAQEILSSEIDSLDFNSNEIKILSNYSAEFTSDTNNIKKNLKNQMANRVRWTESIKRLEKSNYKNILEIGPGNVLSGLIKRISDSFVIKSINKVEDLNKL